MNNKFEYITSKQLCDIRQQAEDRISQIRNTPNMTIPEGATVYYLSPSGDDQNDGRSPNTAWRTLNKLSSEVIENDSYVCFERGGVYRGVAVVRDGVTYTAYGEGEKPKLYASPENGADPQKWIKSDVENIWYYETGNLDIGVMVFNDGEQWAIKALIRKCEGEELVEHATNVPFSSWRDLNYDLQFYHDCEDKKVYLYSVQNPGERFHSIEFAIGWHMFSQASSPKNVTFDNLCFKYCGSHAIGLCEATGLTVKNCEFAWVGGSLQFYLEDGVPVRFGNAVEIWGPSSDFTVENCCFDQIYDAAMTSQFNISDPNYECIIKNVKFSRNVVQRANYSVELFLHGCKVDTPSGMYGVEVSDNLFLDAGVGYCWQRPDRVSASHIKNSEFCRKIKDYVIKNNVMCGSVNMLIWIHGVESGFADDDSLPILENNTFVGKIGCEFGLVEQSENGQRRIYDEKIVDYLGERYNNNTLLFLLD